MKALTILMNAKNFMIKVHMEEIMEKNILTVKIPQATMTEDILVIGGITHIPWKVTIIINKFKRTTKTLQNSMRTLVVHLRRPAVVI